MTDLKNRRGLIAIIATIATVVVIAILASGVNPGHAIATAIRRTGDGQSTPARVIHYYAHDTDNLNFGPSPIGDAQKAGVETLDYVWHLDNKGQPVGNFPDRLKIDPALLGAIATDVTGRNSETWSTILGDRAEEFKKLPAGQRADALHLAFLKDDAYWTEVRDNLLNFFKRGQASVSELQEYTSSMYMLDYAVDGDKPAVVVRKTENSGGHFLWFNLKGDGVYGYRLECGYQPVDVETYWTPPQEPPVKDNPPPEPTTQPTTEPTTKPTTLKPKDANAGPQAQTGGKNSSYGGGVNRRNDTKLTNEPTSPKTYTQPARPTTSKPTTAKPATQAQKTTQVNNKTYEVVTGNSDSKNYQSLDEVQKNPPPVEEGLNNKTNSGAITAPE